MRVERVPPQVVRARVLVETSSTARGEAADRKTAVDGRPDEPLTDGVAPPARCPCLARPPRTPAHA